MTQSIPRGSNRGRGGQTDNSAVRFSNRLRGNMPEGDTPATTPSPSVESTATAPDARGENTPQENIRLEPHSAPFASSSKQVIETSTSHEDERQYPNIFDDADPLNEDATEAEKNKYIEDLHQKSEELLAAFQEIELEGEELWLEFITSFRPHTIKLWKRILVSKWTKQLTKMGVYVERGRRVDKAQALIELLYRKDHISFGKSTVDVIQGSLRQMSIDNGRKEPFIHPDRRDQIIADNVTQNTISGSQNDHVSGSGAPGGGPPDDGDDDAIDPERYKDTRKGLRGSRKSGYAHNTDVQYNDGVNEHENRNRLGVNGLMRAFIGKPTFGGSWDEDLDNCIGVFDTLSVMCEITPQEKLKSIPVMLTGDALNYYANNLKFCTTYETAMEKLREWYNSDDRRSRILTKWQSMTLSQAMSENPEESEATVFRKFVATLMSLQNQLDETYHTDQFLRDRLMTAVNIPSIQAALRDRMPRTSQQAVNRIANQLSEKPQTAGSNIVCTMEDDEDDHAYYSLGKSFGGDAKRRVRKPWVNRPGGRGRNNMRNRQQRLSPEWMRGVKGCFVCGEDHRANTRHSREEVTAAVDRLKSKHPKALLTVEDLAAIVLMVGSDSEEKGHTVEWATESDEDNEDEYAMMADDAAELEKDLANCAFIHGRTYNEDMRQALKSMRDQLTKTEDSGFNGVKLDTGCNRRSVMSESQWLSYQKEFNCKIKLRPPTRKTLRGLGGHREILGNAIIQIPFPKLGLIIDVDFSIIKEDIPTLLSNRDMINNGLDLSLQGGFLYIGNLRQPLTLENYLFVHRWTSASTPYILYTEDELRKIHRNFGHPSVIATQKLLRRASGEKLDEMVRKGVEKIAEDCDICKKNNRAPRRFKLTIGTDNLKFNHNVIVDTMFIGNRPILHMVDESTHFAAAAFLKNQSTEEIWKQIMNLWVLSYMGPPDFLSVDQGTAYISKEMKANASAAGISLLEAPIETPGAIGIVERYHAPLRSAYTKLRQTLEKDDASDQDCLKMAVYACNSTMGPEGLCPMLLVFGALPRPARKTPSPTQLVRQKAIEDAKLAVEKEQAKRRISFALRHSGSPKALEVSEELRNLHSGAPVLVYRTKSKSWEGPYKFIGIDDETVIVQLPRGRKIFRSTCIKPWRKSDLGCKQHCDDEMKSNVETFVGVNVTNDDNIDKEEIDLGNQPRKVKVRKGSAEERFFASSRKDELEGLILNGTFEKVEESKIDSNVRVFGSRFVDELKKIGSELKKKSRLIAQNYSDEAASSIATKAPTVQRFSQRVALSIAASNPALIPYTRDITQAYVQSHSHLERDVYIRAPPELGLGNKYVLKVVKPLYGIPESGLHWYLTYLTHHLETLNMKRARADPCVLIRRNATELDGIILLQVDDSLGAGTSAFMAEEEIASKVFKCKARSKIEQDPTTFNGISISKDEETICIKQTEKIDKLKVAKTQEEFASQRALMQYIGVNTRPDLCAPVQIIAPGSKPTTVEEMKRLTKYMKFLTQTKSQGLRYVQLDLSTIRIVLMTDASFANAKGLKSQLGYLVLMVDDNDNCNILHYGSNKCQRIARSVMAAEIHALVLGFDYAYLVKNLVEEILGRSIKMHALVDSETVFNVIAKEGKTMEKRLQIDILALKQSYDEGELDSIAWIPGSENAADPLTKPVLKETTPLYRIMVENKLSMKTQGWAAGISSELK